MSKISLRAHFVAFAGDNEARIAVVADALVSAVIVTAQHGTFAPLLDAVIAVDSLKGKAAYVQAIRAGLAACGLKATPNGKAVQGDGLKVGKMTADAAETLAQSFGESFTLAASTIINTPKEKKPGDSAATIAAKAFTALQGLTLRDLRKALAGNDARVVLANLAIIAAEDAQAEAARIAAEALKTAGAPVDGPTGIPAVDAAMTA